MMYNTKTALLMLNKSCILTPSLERHTKSNVAAPRFHKTNKLDRKDSFFMKRSTLHTCDRKYSSFHKNLIRNYDNLNPWFGVPC